MLRASGLCTTPMCDSGIASIREMDSVFQGLPHALQDQYQSAHDALMTTFNNTYSWTDSWIPFNPACCTVQELGTQADRLTGQMQAAIGQVGLSQGPGTQAQPGGLLDILGSPSTLWALVALGVLFLYGTRRIL